MSLTFSALCYLHAWEHRLPLQDGLAFEPLLRRIRLDYSLDSLARIDTFLDALRTAKKPRAQAFLAEPANQNLLYLLAFYTGEVVSRALGRPPEWSAAGPDFEGSAVCNFPGTAARLADFAPLVAICSRLFQPNVEKSVHFSATGVLPPELVPRCAAMGRLKPAQAPAPVDAAQAMQRLTPGAREELTLREPPWIAQDGLAPLFKAAPDLLWRGRVVWAALVQANNDLLRADGEFAGAPGEVVYDPAGRVPADVLAAVARQLFALKGTQPQEPALARYAAYLDAEDERVFGLDVPPQACPYPLKASSTWFQRSYLPGRRLAQPCFPVLVSEQHPGLVLFLPHVLWPQALLEAWG
jgi:hypothetical protein